MTPRLRLLSIAKTALPDGEIEHEQRMRLCVAGIRVESDRTWLRPEELPFLLQHSGRDVAADLITGAARADATRVPAEEVVRVLADDRLGLVFLIWILEGRYAPKPPSVPDEPPESFIDALEAMNWGL